VALHVLGNKVTDPADVDYLRAEVGDALLGWLTQSIWVRWAERGDPAPIGSLEPANRAVLDRVRAALDDRRQDCAAYHRNTVAFHLRNGEAWANETVGADLAQQIDPDFVPGRVAVPGGRLAESATSSSTGGVHGALAGPTGSCCARTTRSSGGTSATARRGDGQWAETAAGDETQAPRPGAALSGLR
jgi:hypothetical protein